MDSGDQKANIIQVLIIKNSQERTRQPQEDFEGPGCHKAIQIIENVASARKRNNQNWEMKVPGHKPTQDREAISKFITEFFISKWREQDIGEENWPSLNAQKEVVNRDDSEEEIWEVVKAFGKYRAPGRNGITAFFFNFWSIVEKQVAGACLEFFSTGVMVDE
ncbi:hypothetical protein KFK09_006209 [Dendrobium nobile]|uniref:Uncharacterized protein n=1 Tax=Dendrobium nobile TaxID=94219 RepID=A0A8T3BT12_DENNO|nr:hypothetical protein KFK09_006209 [Dendrobium nobile]